MLTFTAIRQILGRISYKRWSFCVKLDGDRPYLQLRWLASCADTGNVEEQSSRKWFLSYHMTPSEVVQTAFKACLTAEEHEVRENFRYRDKPIFGPHFDVEALAEICHRTETRE